MFLFEIVNTIILFITKVKILCSCRVHLDNSKIDSKIYILLHVPSTDLKNAEIFEK